MPEKCGLSPQATHGKGIVGGLHAASHKMVAILPLLAGTDASCWCGSGLDVPIIGFLWLASVESCVCQGLATCNAGMTLPLARMPLTSSMRSSRFQGRTWGHSPSFLRNDPRNGHLQWMGCTLRCVPIRQEQHCQGTICYMSCCNHAASRMLKRSH